MKLTVFFLTAALVQVSARGLSQTVSFSGKDIPLQTVFSAVEKQTGYVFFYDAAILKEAKPVTVSARGLPLEDFVKLILQGQPLKYLIEKKAIIITRNMAPPPPVLPLPADVPPIDIHGRVTDSLGEPLEGASITVKGAKKGVFTDILGHFELKNVEEGAILIVTYTGYQNKEITVQGHSDISVLLRLSNSPLDEAQVIAYGTVSKRLNTGNVTTVKGADIEKQPVSNPILALEGRVPGLFITQYSGMPGGNATVRVQGQNSISNGNDPLYVVDGVPYNSQMISSSLMSGSVGSAAMGGGSPFNYINPSDIESIDILKDADATAIYGSRAANGAVLITTKKGVAGQTKVDVNGQQGWGKVTRMLHLLNTQQYLEMRHEALQNDGITAPSATDYDINGTWDSTRYTDWQKFFIGGTSQYTNVTASVSGGNASTQYLVGGTYHRETTVLPGNFSDVKGAVHFSLNNVSSNQRFRIQLTGNYLLDDGQLPNNDFTNSITLAPDAPSLLNANGSLNWAPNAAGTSTINNPLRYLYEPYLNKTNNLIGNAVLSYKILSGLEVRTSLGYTNMQINEYNPIGPLIATKPELRATSTRSAYYGNNDVNSWIVEPQVSYKKNLGQGKLEALVGTTILQNNSNGENFTGSGYNTDVAMADIHSAATVTVNTNLISVYKYNAGFGRINYNWENEFLLDLVARRDGSSRFGPQSQFHDFESAGAAWIFTEEGFIKKNLPSLNFGKLRASYGTTGNDQIGDYKFLNLYSPTSAAVPYEGATGLAVNGLPNPYLQWETTRKLQVGLDLGFLKDRILFSANYADNRSSNELLTYALPSTAGFTTITSNFPATVQNKDWEVSLNTTNIKSRSFTWTSTVNLTVPKNKLLAFPNLTTSSYASSLIIGQPVNIVKVYHFLGVNPTTGEYQYDNGHGSPTPTPTQRTSFVNTLPKFYGGFDNTFSYKGLEFDIFMQFVKQTGAKYFHLLGTPGEFSSGVNNEPVSVLNRWRKPGDITNTERFTTNASWLGNYFDIGSSDFGYGDASFIRLKNLALSYQLPASWRQKAHLQNCRVYVQGQNLWTITKYQGMDPENQKTGNLPPLRVLTVGIQVGF